MSAGATESSQLKETVGFCSATAVLSSNSVINARHTHRQMHTVQENNAAVINNMLHRRKRTP